MGRQVRDAKLETREARARLKARGNREPHWRLLEEGLHLGYRKGVRGGVWYVRYRDGDGYTKRALADADDVQDADNIKFLTFAQAQKKTFALLAPKAPPSKATIADTAVGYLDYMRHECKSYATTEVAINAHILPALGSKRIDELSVKALNHWLDHIARSPARKRTRPGEPRAFREAPQTSEERRARQATANRIRTILVAMLNHAVEQELVPSSGPFPWREMKRFKKVDEPVIRFLTEDQAKAVIVASAPTFRPLVQGALFVGARYGELVALRVSDVNIATRKVYFAPSKSGKPRHVPLSDAGLAFFASLVADRDGAELLFQRGDGGAWGKNYQVRPLLDACAQAGIDPPITFHELRHTYASLLAQAGCDLLTISKLLGHADTRVTARHYAHLCDRTLAAAVEARLPTFGHAVAA